MPSNLAYHIAEQVKLTAMQSAIGPTQRTHRTRLAAMHHDTIISFCPNPAAFHAATSYDFPAPTKDRDPDYWKQWAAANTAYQQHITTPMLRKWAAHILDYVQQPTYRVEPSDPPAAR